MAESSKKNKEAHDSTPIIGIGASAGALNALKTLLNFIPENTGFAYVIVVHLSPDHKSALPELLQPAVKMPVIQVNKTMELKPDHVYVIPPNANLNTIDTHVRLSKLEERRSERAPIDHFFRTLADVHDGNSIGIILTGTGSDGTLGLKEIKEKGGLTIVQDPDEAEYDGMPQSAISTGLVDIILPLKEIPAYVINYLSTKPKLKSLETNKPDNEEYQIIQKILAQVRARTGRDFNRYKLSTILRRLQRRMQIYQVELLNDYLEILRRNPEEVRALSDDFLITVTSFFRDPEVFKFISEKVIHQILNKRRGNDQIRIWTIGCATGEEAYSLAMLFFEVVGNNDEIPHVQIFASDLHEVSLKRAREGYYPGDIKSEVNNDRLRKFFTKENNGYRIRKELREHVIFTPHNLLGDPPFSRLDLIVCRNLLIYLKRDVQREVFELFHYSLQPDGFLVLGTSEHLENTELFSVENKEFSVYRKKNVTGPEPRLPVFPRVYTGLSTTNTRLEERIPVSPGILHHKIIESQALPSLLIGEDYQIIHVSESCGRFLSIPGGEITRDAFKLINPQLQLELRSVIYSAKENNRLVRSKPIHFQIEGEQKQVFILSRVVQDPGAGQIILVMFEEFEESYDSAKNVIEEDQNKNANIEQLEREVQETRQRLQAIIEEYETSREEMKASNEELQSANEELRSTMEELETSKEELQSVNEELSTLNQENRHKVEELAQLTSDLQNLLAATDIATLFLDKNFRILRFTPRLSEIFNVLHADRGRLISDITNKLSYDNLVGDAKQVLKNLQSIEKEIMDKDGNTYLTRLLPYRSSEDKIEGVVITFVDITERKKWEETLQKAKTEAERAAHAKEEFLAHMSHEIRTPLNAIVGIANLLLKQEPKNEQLENLNTLKVAAQNLSSLINNILDFSKIQAGKLLLELTPVEVYKLVKAIVQLHSNKATEKEIKLEYFIDDKLPDIIICDQLKLSQVLHNLLSNAIKFTHKGKVTLEVKLVFKNRKNINIEFVITDTGIGIPNNRIESIFDVFNQGDNSTIKEYGGTGLGLSITKRYLKLMNSEINVESVPGKGSKFFFTLDAKVGSKKDIEHQKLVFSENADNLDHIRLLLAEDDDFNRLVMQQLLNSWGIKFDEAINGKGAFGMAKDNLYDIILMDVHMPIMDGTESASKIRELSNYKNTPIVALTADISENLRKEMKNGLFTDIIIKPIEPDNLLAKIMEILANKEK